MKCDEGYICDICQQDVAALTDSDLYLRFLLGEVRMEQLPRHPERHIRCHPELAQYVVDDRFEPVVCHGPFAKGGLDPDFVRDEEIRVTAAFFSPLYLPL